MMIKDVTNIELKTVGGVNIYYYATYTLQRNCRLTAVSLKCSNNVLTVKSNLEGSNNCIFRLLC